MRRQEDIQPKRTFQRGVFSVIPQILYEVSQHLSEKRLALPSTGADARSDSAVAEGTIVTSLLNAGNKEWGIYSPNVDSKNNRSWYDVKIGDLFVDIKITTLDTRDNTNAKAAIFYLLTGLDLDNFVLKTQEKYYFKDLKTYEIPDEHRDYYYLVINKRDTTDIFPVSLKGIKDIAPNPSNPPFQARFDNCREPVQRTWEEAKNFLLNVWAESVQRKIKSLGDGMWAHYPEYFFSKNEGLVDRKKESELYSFPENSVDIAHAMFRATGRKFDKKGNNK